MSARVLDALLESFTVLVTNREKEWFPLFVSSPVSTARSLCESLAREHGEALLGATADDLQLFVDGTPFEDTMTVAETKLGASHQVVHLDNAIRDAGKAVTSEQLSYYMGEIKQINREREIESQLAKYRKIIETDTGKPLTAEGLEELQQKVRNKVERQGVGTFRENKDGSVTKDGGLLAKAAAGGYVKNLGVCG